jgi:hypothetical protein
MLIVWQFGQRKSLQIPARRIIVATSALQRDVVPFLKVQSMVQYLNPLASLRVEMMLPPSQSGSLAATGA